MALLPKALQQLIEEFRKLPGIGSKTAERLALHLLRSHRAFTKSFGESITNLKEKVKTCDTCFLPTEKNPCGICSDPRRDQHIICVVEDVPDAIAIEHTKQFHGIYHILQGRIAPLDDMGPDQLHIRELVRRVENGKKTGRVGESLEIILATNPSSEGEITAIYLQKLLKPLGVKITRIARGLPVGASLEYADDITLMRALEGRREF